MERIHRCGKALERFCVPSNYLDSRLPSCPITAGERAGAYELVHGAQAEKFSSGAGTHSIDGNDVQGRQHVAGKSSRSRTCFCGPARQLGDKVNKINSFSCFTAEPSIWHETFNEVSRNGSLAL